MNIDESVGLTATCDFQNQPGVIFDEGVGMHCDSSMSEKPPEPKLENGITVGFGGVR